ncbi:MAG: hypothetical protein ACE366_12420 [Bradymonadia bacterium]
MRTQSIYNATLGALLALLLTGCGQTAAPRIIEIESPRDTANPVGPYQVAVVADGLVDGGVVLWRVGGETLPEEVALSRVDGRRWIGLIPGAAPGTEIEFAVRVDGPGGSDRSPDEGFRSFSISPRSGQCLVDGDCDPGLICDRLENICQPQPAVCQDDGDCPQDFECPQPGNPCRFRGPECSSDEECAPGLSCMLPPGRCVRQEECILDEDCPPGEMCSSGQCTPQIPMGCEELGCPDGQVCVDNACVPIMGGCPEGCPPGEVCLDDACVPEPTCADQGCPDGLRCLRDENRCVACTADGMCPEGTYCDLDVYQCAPGYRGQICVPCGRGGTCGAGLVCDEEFLGVCLQPCDAGQCPQGTFCDAGICRPDVFCQAQECFFDEECDTGVCSGGVCEPVQLCETSDDCGEDLGGPRQCVFGRCLPTAPNCTSPFECINGSVCMGGRCVPGDTASACTPCDEPADCGATALCGPVSQDGTNRCVSYCGAGGCPPGLECLDVGGGSGICLDPNQGTCIDPQPQPECVDDNLEENDILDQATRIGGGAEIQSQLCPADDDWYLVRVRNNREATIVVTTLTNSGDAPRYALVNEDGFPVEEGVLGAQQILSTGCNSGDAWLFLSCQNCSARYTIETEVERCQ